VEVGEMLFCSLNQAFIDDPEIDEVDIVPCFHCQEEQRSEKEEPVIIVNHKLGIKSWCIKPLFLFAYNKFMRGRLKGKKDCNLSVTESIQLTRAVLLINAECHTAWNARKEMTSSGVLSLKDDWRFSGVVLSKHPRSAETFAHRRWIIIQLEKHKGQDEFIQHFLRNELATTLRAAEGYADNYTAWSHRAWVVEKFMHDKKKKLFCEFQTMRVWTERHISDNCGFHHQQFLLKHLKNVCSKGELVHLLLSELNFTTDLILTFPGHEVLWYHRRFMYHVWNQWFAGVAIETLREIASSTSSDVNRMESNNKTARRSSPSIIPSLFELASSSFKILKEFSSSAGLGTSVTETIENGTSSPLSISAEVRFCDTVISKCQGSEEGVQRRCALNYKQWIMSRSKPCPFECNGAVPDKETTTTAS